MSDKQSRDISEKYSPEWFYEIAQTREYVEFDKKAKQLQADFVNQFGTEQLKSLTGKDLLTSLFFNNEGNKTNLCFVYTKNSFSNTIERNIPSSLLTHRRFPGSLTTM